MSTLQISTSMTEPVFIFANLPFLLRSDSKYVNCNGIIFSQLFFSFIFSPITSWIFRRTAAAFFVCKKIFLPLHFYALLHFIYTKTKKSKVNTHVCMYSWYKASSSYFSFYYLLYVLISISPLLPQQYNPLITKSASGIFFRRFSPSEISSSSLWIGIVAR